jgi:acyl carrier protein
MPVSLAQHGALPLTEWLCDWRTAPTSRAMNEKIRQAISDHARLPVDVSTLSDDADLYQAGMTSHASVNVMLALEDGFDIEFPDRMLKREVFESVASIHAALIELEVEVVG